MSDDRRSGLPTHDAASPSDLTDGLRPEELRAEQAGDLPEREAMSILGVGGLDGGLPPVVGDLGGLLDGGVGGVTQPVESIVDQVPVVGQLPIDGLPIVEDLPTDPFPTPLPPIGGLPGASEETLPIDAAPVDGDARLPDDRIGIPSAGAAPGEARTLA